MTVGICERCLGVMRRPTAANYYVHIELLTVRALPLMALTTLVSHHHFTDRLVFCLHLGINRRRYGS